MMLKVVSEHLEDDFAKGKVILVCFKVFVLLGEPIVKDFNVNAPNDVIEEP